MILTDCDIRHFRELNLLDVAPWNDSAVQPASVDLHLAPYVTHPVQMYHAPGGHESVEPCTEKFEELCACQVGPSCTGPEILAYRLEPGQFALFSTIETVTLSAGVAAQVAGKSSWARRGLIVESAGWVDPGFRGQLTLELKNLTEDPIMLTAGDPICQIVFMECRRPAIKPYGSEGVGRYQNQTGPTAAR